MKTSRSTTTDTRSPSIAIAASLAIIGWIAGLAVGRVGTGTGFGVATFRQNPWYEVLVAVGAFIGTLGLALGYWGLHLLRNLMAGSPKVSEGIERWRLTAIVVAPLCISVVAAVLATALTLRVRGTAYPLAHATFRQDAFVVIGIAATLPSGVGLCWIMLQAYVLRKEVDRRGESTPEMMERFIQYQEASHHFLGMVSVVVAIGVAHTGTARRALIGSEHVPDIEYPAEFVLLYGAVLAIAVASVYLPAALTLRRTGRALRDSAAQGLVSNASLVAKANVGQWVELQECRNRLDQVLGLQLGIVERIQVTLGMLAPFLTSLLSTILPGAA